MATPYARFSISCWFDRDARPRDFVDEHFDSRDQMDREVERLLRKGKFKSISIYSWDYDANDWYEEDEITLQDL